MDSELLRFECRREESGTWMVWDRFRQQVAEIGGCVLSGREEDRARVACTVLTRIYKNMGSRRSAAALQNSDPQIRRNAEFDALDKASYEELGRSN